jgi:uncharacterized membrane protein HdeD (DUF308 family)
MAKKKRGLHPISLSRKNYLFLLGGILSIGLGYLTLSRGSITIAPILLVLGYCILIPVGIIIR